MEITDYAKALLAKKNKAIPLSIKRNKGLERLRRKEAAKSLVESAAKGGFFDGVSRYSAKHQGRKKRTATTYL